MCWFGPSRTIYLDDLSEMDKLFIVGCADAGSEIWCRENYRTDEQHLTVLLVLAESPYSNQSQKEGAIRLIQETRGRAAEEAKAALCKKRRVEFERRRRAAKLFLIDRDGYGCVECGTQEDLTVDHVIPLSKGGTDDLENLRFLCRGCNSHKGDKFPDVSHGVMLTGAGDADDAGYDEPPDVAAALDNLGL